MITAGLSDLVLAASAPVLRPFEILNLVGFATGAALHLYLCLMLYRQYGLRRVERPLLALGFSIGLWHLGNFAEAMYQSLFSTEISETVAAGGGLVWLRASNTVAYVALAFLPPLLAHSHFRIWSWFDPRAPKKLLSLLGNAGYVPMLLLPWVIMRIWSEPYQPPIEKLAPLLLPFIGWIVFIFLECAAIDWRLARTQPPGRERRFFEVFGMALVVIGALFLLTYILGARSWGPFGRYLDLLARLSSVAPTALVAYYIYRYRYLELVIRQSFVYAALAALVMMVYVYGIRRFSLFLDERFHVRPEAVESLLILVLIFLSGPLRRLSESYLQRLLRSEVGLYRDLVSQVGAAGASYGELAHFIDFAERRLCESLELKGVRILALDGLNEEERRIGQLAEERQQTQIEDPALLAKIGAVACYVLWREGRVVGLLILRGAAQELTAEKREVLAVLAGHLAVALENCRLLEEKVKLERELAERERMASLGQMAARVAHEVKNPLSAIKSIAQVMREDPAVRQEYSRDLDLILGEVDRLSRSVSQLLSFSRPAVVAASAASLQEIVESAIAIARLEAAAERITINAEIEADRQFSGESAAALKEVLINLTLNAVQSLRDGGSIRIESRRNGDRRLHLSVTDDGCGIPAAMHEKIFEPFFTTKQRGTGLGLAIVGRRMRELGGSIKIVSPVANGHGTRFDLFLQDDAACKAPQS